MRTDRGVVLAVCFLVSLLISACSGLPFGAGSSSGQASTPTVNCRALARHGVHTCPPVNPTLDTPQMINHAQRMVSSAQFKRYVQGLLRNLAYEEFALNTSQASLLRAGVLATPRATNLIYHQDFSTIDIAQQLGPTLTDIPAPITSIKLVILPKVDQGYIRANGYVATNLAWIVTGAGPAWAYVTKDGSFTLLGSESVHGSQLFWGRYHEASDLGPIWTFDGSTPCDPTTAWQAVCDQ